MMYTKFLGSAHSRSSASRVASEGTAILGVLTIGVKVPCGEKHQDPAEFLWGVLLSWTHIVVEEEQSLLRLEIPILQPVLLHERSLPGHDVLETHLLKEHIDQVRSPRVTGVDVHDLVHLVVPLSLLLCGHRESAVDRVGDVTKVPWVDLKSLRHVVRNTHEFGEDEWALLGPFLSDDELHRCGVHTVTKGGDEGEISDGQEGVELVLLDGLVIMVDGNEVQRTILSVDVSDELGHLTLQFWRIRQGGRGDLDEDYLSDPLREVFQQFFERT